MKELLVQIMTGLREPSDGTGRPGNAFYASLRRDFQEIDWESFDWYRWNASLVAAEVPTSFSSSPRQPRLWGLAAHSGPMVSLAADHLRPLGVRDMQVHTSVGYCKYHMDEPAVRCGELPGFPNMQSVLKGSVGTLKEAQAWDRRVLQAARASADYRHANVVVCSFPASACSAFLRPGGKRGISRGGRRLLVELGWRHDQQRHNAAACAWVAQLAALLRESRHLVVAHTAYDVAYVHHYTGLGRQVQLLEYTSGRWLQAAAEVPTQRQHANATILLLPDRRHTSRVDPDQQLARIFQMVMAAENFELAFARELYGSFYQPAQVLQHRAVIAIPYSAYSFQLADWYWLGMTLFVPARRLLALFHYEFGVLYELLPHCRDTGLPCRGCSAPGWNSSAAGHRYAPQDVWSSLEAAEYWFGLFWIYNVPGIRVFVSTSDLAFQLKDFSAEAARQAGRRIRARNRRVLQATRKRWHDLLAEQMRAA